MNDVGTGESEGGQAAHLERVREILFGAQARSFESKLDEVEARLQARLDRMRQEIADESARLAAELRREIEELSERQRTERRVRGDALTGMASELQNQSRLLGDRVAEFEERVTSTQRETRRELEGALRSVREFAQTSIERSSREFEGRAADVDRRKVERGELALVLTDLAGRLAGTSPPTEGDEPKNGVATPMPDS